MSQPPDAQPFLLRWLIEGNTVHPHNRMHNHNLLPNHAQFRMVTPPSDLAISPDQNGWHWRINTWEIVEMPDWKGEWYKFVKVVHCHFMTDDEVQRFKARVGYDAIVRQEIENREVRAQARKAEALDKGA